MPACSAQITVAAQCQGRAVQVALTALAGDEGVEGGEGAALTGQHEDVGRGAFTDPVPGRRLDRAHPEPWRRLRALFCSADRRDPDPAEMRHVEGVRLAEGRADPGEAIDRRRRTNPTEPPTGHGRFRRRRAENRVA